ncbi:MAG: chromosome partition protein MukB [Myxococcales bacterium]|nr:chromosome partition protein MukB [Myxococcales bacterium]
MRRARATALALVNWKGVFYERYELDPRVTALEGANGSGKTTVMVAAYVVLMPDMTRLRFSSVGESSGAGADKGLYGRLGEPGSPSFAALEVEVDHGRRVVLGVCLTRKAEPTVELTPFLVTGTDLQGSLKGLLLGSDGEHDVLPTLAEVKAAGERLGGHVEIFASAKDYFAALFDHGITPLRLASDEDRAKLNEMLRTSMTGGISRALTGELRSFLLREEPGLGETLTHMRANLDACHRTRAEVAEARVLERELSAVYEAARATLDATLTAVATAAREAEAETRAAEGAAAESELAARALREEADALGLEVTRANEALHAARALAEHSTSLAERTARALEASERSRAAAETLGLADARSETTRADLEGRVRGREVARDARDRARDAYDRTARGLADLQAGLGDLHVSAQAARQQREALAEAWELLATTTAEPSDAPRLLEEASRRLGALDEARVRVERELATASRRKDEHSRALTALRALAPESSGDDPYAEARAVLARLAEAEGRVARLPDLERRAVEARALAERQSAARARAARLFPELAELAPDAGARLEALRLPLEERFQAAEAAAAEQTVRALALEHERADATARAGAIRVSAERYARAHALAEGLADALTAAGRPTRAITTQSEGAAARAALDEALGGSRDAVRARRAERERVRHEIEAIERHAGGGQEPDLLRLRDELDGELLSLRYEDLELGEAARKEAALGPLVGALVVDSPEHALRAIVGKPREAATVFLVRPDAEVGAQTIVGESQGDVVVAEPYGFRVTRIEREPRLGARARAQRANALREELARLDAAIADAERRAERLEGARSSLDTLFVDLAVLEAGAPTEELARASARAAHAEAELVTCAASLAATRQLVSELRPRVEALRSLASEALFLEPPDHGALADALATELGLAREEVPTGHQKDTHKQLLSSLIHSLAEGLPPEDGALRSEQETLRGERDRVFRLQRALTSAVEAGARVVHVDAERVLSARAEIVPALEASHSAARDEATAAESRVTEAERAWEAGATAHQLAELERGRAQAELDRARADLAREDVGSVGQDALERAVATAEEARRATSAAEATARELGREQAVRAERAVAGARLHEARVRDAARVRERLVPAKALLDTLADEVQAGGVSWPEPVGGDPATLFAEARGQGQVLAERLGRARAGTELAEALRERLLTPDNDALARSALAAWRDVVAWLQRRLPLAISALADPTRALLRLRDDLSSLESRLGHQETELRGASEDVARGIDVQLRRARSQVRRLNQSLAGVRFGSIGGIRIQMTRVERMDQVLSALREGQSQDLLFDPRMPVEEALAEIFRRHAGGKAGSQRILDYREYLELSVDVQRAGKSEWEAASPARLSTGEGIGVGAAILMVVLTEWERDSNLLRTRRPMGSMRFLFLDEANRLSQDNLSVLFDLCQTLELQLLVAAPEVSRAEGATTYRLVRRTDESGRDEVLVSGRRALRESAPAEG